MPRPFDILLSDRLEQKVRQGTLRRLPSNQSGLVDFSSNDYLGLAKSEELATRIDYECRRKGKMNGSTGSRLLTGNDVYTEQVEAELAAIFHADAALLFNSGYSANLAVLSSLPRKDDTILYDELAHASIKDGARLSLARRFSFAHNDVDDLERRLRLATGRVYIAVESVYSMDGDVCPLKAIHELALKYDATIILDEAHSTGVMGHNGGGMSLELGLAENIPVRIFTFGKAMGVHGACVAGSVPLRDYLVNFARPFIYTTAPNRHFVASIRCAFLYLQENIALCSRLNDNIAYFLDETKGLKNRTQSYSAIQTMIIPGAHEAKQVAETLQANGMDVRAIVSPTVPKGKERLRICLHAFNTFEEIQKLTSLMKAQA